VTITPKRVDRIMGASLAELEEAFGGGPSCRVCGCTDDDACPGGCWWAPDPEGGDLCSQCAHRLGLPLLSELGREADPFGIGEL
jgi:hypothetical protein